MTDYTSSAAALYNGGWRAEDKDELIEEYDLTEEEAEKLCEHLKRLEAQIKEVKTMKKYVIKKVTGAEISTRAMKEYENAIDAFVADGMNYKPDELGSYESREQALEALKGQRCTIKAMTSYGVLAAVDECDKPKFYEVNMIYIDEQEYDEDFESWESTGEYDFAEMEM